MNNINTYELAFLALAELSEQEVEAVQSTLAEAVAKAGGQVVSKGDVHFIRLAYTMIKKIGSKNVRHDEAYFSWVKATLDTSAISLVEESLRSNNNVLRHMITSVPHDNTLTEVFTMEGTEDEETTEAAATTTEVKEEVVEKQEANATLEDLARIEGIGPVIATTLANAGITTYAMLADASTETLGDLLEGVRGNHDPTTWGEQAALARDEKWDELQELQDNLKGGVKE